MFRQSEWIGAGREYAAPIFIKRFQAQNPERAVIDISGLGYYELFINGKRVGEDYFKPAVSDYAERDFSDWLYPLTDKTSHTVYYNTYDLKKYLKAGENTLAVMLGNGFFRQIKRNVEGNTQFGDELILRYELRITENGRVQTVCSDGTEKVAPSFIKENNLFFGEVHDYADFNGEYLQGKGLEKLPFAHTRCALNAKILKQRCPNDRVRRVIAAKPLYKTETGVIYDVGVNLSGFVRFRAKSDRVVVRHAENVKGERLDYSSAGGNGQVYENRFENAKGKEVQPWFSWGGFRYFEIEGEVENVEACFVHADLKITAEFSCGNENLNWLFNTYLHTQLCNMHGGVPSDCPHRERLGYTGDGQVTAESAMLCLDGRRFYEKWTRDIADCQDRESGHVQHTAPFFGGGGGPGGWGSAIVLVPYAYYKSYKNKKILKKYFKNMLAYLRCMKGFCEDGLVVKEREKGWCLGEWCTPERVALPEPFVNTYYYIRCMERVREIAQILGLSVALDGDIKSAKDAVVRAYFDSETGDFCEGKQGANAYALTLGLGDARTERNLLARYKTTGALDTGIFGTEILSEYLVKKGEIQLLCDLLGGERFPSFGYMRAQGATTLWETWSGHGSHNHPMFGGCVKSLVYGLLGLEADAGFENVKLSPKYVEGINFLRVKLKLPSGVLKIEYEYKNGRVYQK